MLYQVPFDIALFPRSTLWNCMLLVCLPASLAPAYDVVAVKSERHPTERVDFPEVKYPIHHPPSDLVVLHADGTEKTLVEGGGDALFDPKLSTDGKWLYYVRMRDCLERTSDWVKIPKAGADIYRLNLTTHAIERLTYQHDTFPMHFADPRHASFGYGVFNLGPCPLPDGTLVFTSSRDRLQPTKKFTYPCLQLYRRWGDGSLERIGVMSQGSALHPVLMRNGAVAFSSYESMGLRDRRIWSLWSIHPDGTNWGPLISAYFKTSSYHFHTQRSSGEIVATAYYNQNNNGLGTLVGLSETPGPFGDPLAANNQPIQLGLHRDGKPKFEKWSTPPQGLRAVTPWAPRGDVPSETGKVTHPAAAPDNALLLTYSPGPANRKRQPIYQFMIARIAGDVAESVDELEILKSDPDWNYTQPQPVVSWEEIYGQAPVQLPYAVDHTKDYGTVNTGDASYGQWEELANRRSIEQGFSTASKEEPAYLRVVGMEPNIARIDGVDRWGRRSPSGETGWSSAASERLRIVADVPLNDADRPPGDRSASVRIPADMPFTFALVGSDGRHLTFAQTWHQLRPGEVRDCGGCHNHSESPVAFEGTFADLHAPFDATRTEQRHVEYYRDVLPILQKYCYDCHAPDDPSRRGQHALDESVAQNRRLVSPLRSADSPLADAISNDSMPKGRPPLSDADKRVIYEWVDLGCLTNTDRTRSGFMVSNESQSPSSIIRRRE